MAETLSLDCLDKIVQENYSLFKQLHQPAIDRDHYTVLASLNRLSDRKLVALSAGTQACLKKYRDDIQDCHAESLLKRAYKRHVIDGLINDSAKTVTDSDFILFISQFPCGLTNKYKGSEPTDSSGRLIRRKPGRGIVQEDGTTVYVPKPPCTDKIIKWLNGGFQGTRLANLLSFRANIRLIVIGGCESLTESDHRLECDKLRQILLSNCLSTSCSIVGLPSFRPEEFIRSSTKEPHPISTVWWVSNDGSEIGGNLELIVDGRKSGVTFKSLQSGKYKPLKVVDFSINQDIDNIMHSKKQPLESQ